ncbi:polypeptide N-acetylgalactosaminyltransferase 13 [Hydra vulgaris]|uniref:polypeptide N-acetylgalactosaminyltransferase 13 n=1 Tax=Hydra vulgaris TaxID=6087 RepID=UPI001F5F7779|nr:polypeptide N-acetylgalactosaminyltransferase 13-like [Hydra vulgaris]
MTLAEAKLTTRKVLLSIILATTIWFFINIILLIVYNNGMMHSSLEKLAFTSNRRADSNYMQDVNVYPLAPHIKKFFDLSWFKSQYNEDFYKSKYVPEEKIIKLKKRAIYDASKKLPILFAKGEGGIASYLDTEEEKLLAEKLFKNHSFNSVLSNKISLDRTQKDIRGEHCAKKHHLYPEKLPTASVVICFHNEALSVLLRTVHSVLNRTPPELLVDIILVDDKSVYDDLKIPLVKHLNELSDKIQVVRNEERSGLIRSRLAGAEKSRGDVLIFLDSHCETTPGWIEPLLARINEAKSNVVVPTIESIDADTLEYRASDNPEQRGGFSWDLMYDWNSIPENEKHLRQSPSDPIRTPTMAGGLFAIDKSYFFEMGSYDQEMDIWGGENLELSFRIWMCGGRIEILPCSRVGHIFRKVTSPYTFPKGVTETLSKNLNRLAEVWMDEYKEYYYRSRPLFRGKEYGNITQRLELRQKLQCKSFKWYMENIYSDMEIPDLYPPAEGEIRNGASNLCIDSMGVVKENVKHQVGLYPCHGEGGAQHFQLSLKGEIIFQDKFCLDVAVASPGAFIEFFKCHKQRGNQLWQHNIDSGEIVHFVTQQCLDLGVSDHKDKAVMNRCDGRASQKWKFGHYNMTNFVKIPKF